MHPALARIIQAAPGIRSALNSDPYTFASCRVSATRYLWQVQHATQLHHSHNNGQACSRGQRSVDSVQYL
jgi:hypothetical protein